MLKPKSYDFPSGIIKKAVGFMSTEFRTEVQAGD
jgi:hypothetical protein